MPELPEVETIRRDLVRAASGKTVIRAQVLYPGSLRGISVPRFLSGVRRRRFRRFRRRGKYLIMELESGRALVIHLKMTGGLMILGPRDSVPGTARIIFYLGGGRRLLFCDQRKFGVVRLVEKPFDLPELKNLGPEPLSSSFTPWLLSRVLAGRRTPIKAMLLDQSLVAGLGNIYVCEALHRAGIDPRRPASSLQKAEIVRLHGAIVSVLKAAIKARGSSVATYRDGQGRRGWFQVQHRVYDRQGRKCRQCGCAIRRETLRGRGTYWCPNCQR